MEQYLTLLQDIIDLGEKRTNRTGTDTISLFGYQNRYNLQNGFPAVTTKKLFFKGVVHELLWFLKADTNIKYLTDNNVHIWDAWANENGDLGNIYGKQWRQWADYDGGLSHTDQIANAIKLIKETPDSRRIIVNAWNVAEVDNMALPPCHTTFQFYVSNNKLSCQLYQRSADAFLGVPFNIASYALLTHMIAQVCDLQVGDFVHTFGDLHLYVNHMDQVKEQFKRAPLKLPTLWLNPAIKDIDAFTYDDIKLVDYNSYPAIKADIAV